MLMATRLVVTPISHGNGPMDTFLQHEPSSILSATTTDMDTLKRMLMSIHIMPHTATTVMVRLSVVDMIFTLQTMQTVTIILISIATRTPVRIVTILCGQEVLVSVLVR